MQLTLVRGRFSKEENGNNEEELVKAKRRSGYFGTQYSTTGENFVVGQNVEPVASNKVLEGADGTPDKDKVAE